MPPIQSSTSIDGNNAIHFFCVSDNLLGFNNIIPAAVSAKYLIMPCPEPIVRKPPKSAIHIELDNWLTTGIALIAISDQASSLPTDSCLREKSESIAANTNAKPANKLNTTGENTLEICKTSVISSMCL